MSRSSGKQVSSQPVDLKKRDETEQNTKKMKNIIAIIIAAISLISTIVEATSDSKES